ncbi:MAG: glutaredoxin family protein [Spirochaetaceae bacterium]
MARNMIDKLEFEEQPGSVETHDLTMYALSTCAFCKRAIKFLEDHDVKFRYIYLDTINPMVKGTVKSELKSRYDVLPVFPVLVIDEREAITGFVEDKWKQILSLD